MGIQMIVFVLGIVRTLAVLITVWWYYLVNDISFAISVHKFAGPRHWCLEHYLPHIILSFVHGA